MMSLSLHKIYYLCVQDTPDSTMAVHDEHEEGELSELPEVSNQETQISASLENNLPQTTQINANQGFFLPEGDEPAPPGEEQPPLPEADSSQQPDVNSNDADSLSSETIVNLVPPLPAEEAEESFGQDFIGDLDSERQAGDSDLVSDSVPFGDVSLHKTFLWRQHDTCC